MNYLKTYFLPFLTVITPILVGVLTYLFNVGNTKLSGEIANIDRDIKEIEQNRKERDSHQTYVLQVL